MSDCLAASATYKGSSVNSDLVATECRYRIQDLLAEADRDRLARRCFDQRADRRSKHAVRRAAIGCIAASALLLAVTHAPAAPASDLTSTTTPAIAAVLEP